MERIRGVVFQVDLWLPSTSPVLLARTRIRNLNDAATPMYWWTNAAVALTPQTRVLAPATRAFRTEYPNGLGVAAIPRRTRCDVPGAPLPRRRLLLRHRPEQRPWIAAVDADGSGLAHTSTSELRGRKLFVWGTGTGGSRWQQWLSHGGEVTYAEIQAGLAPTQFGAIAVDPARSHGASRASAVADAEAAVEALIGAAPARHSLVAGGTRSTAASRASADGHRLGCARAGEAGGGGEPWCDESGTPFPDGSPIGEQEQVVALLRTGAAMASAGAAAESYKPAPEWDAGLLPLHRSC